MNMKSQGFQRIRKFRKDDLSQIVDIENQAFPKTAYPKEFLLQYANRVPEGFVVLEEDGDILGYIIFDTGGHVYSTAVRPSHRRMGFGGMLFAYASQNAEERLWLEVRSKNDRAIAFYRKMGMKVVGRVPEYYSNDDALIMVLEENSMDTDSME
jgi:ribosomal-protein-alanine N-acetyltransferase